MRVALLALPAVLAVLNTGCGPAKLLPTPRGWPQEIHGRKLYHTPRGFLYATNAASAGWMDRYLQKQLPSIEGQFDVKLSKGVVIVISPGDLPVPEIKGWPPWPLEDMRHPWLPPVTTDDFGLPESRWVCTQPTDSYYHRAVSDYHWKYLTKPANILGAVAGVWPFLLHTLPRQRTYYVKLSDVRRERALATAAIEFCDLPETEIKAKLHQVGEFYDLRERAFRDKHGRCPRRCCRGRLGVSRGRRVGYHAAMGTWIDDANPSPEVRARLAELDAEWKDVDRRIAAESDPDKISELLWRIDELEFEVDELVRGKQ